MTDIST